MKLLKHILNKLPEDVTCRMLLQQSKKALNTVRLCLRFHAHYLLTCL